MSSPWDMSAWCGGIVLLLFVGSVFAIVNGWRYLETGRWLKILLLRNGFETYYRPSGAWAALAKKHRRYWAQIGLASPVIEMAGHQYMEVLYLDIWNILWPRLARCRFVILRDAEQAEEDPEVVGRILGVRLVLLVQAVKHAAHSVKEIVLTKKLILKCGFIASIPFTWTRRSIDLDELIDWYTRQQDQLHKLVSEDQLSAFLSKLRQMEQMLQRLSAETTTALAVQRLIRRQRCVSAETVMALETLAALVAQETEQVLHTFVDTGVRSASLYHQASQKRTWRQDRALGRIWRQARDPWWLIANRARQLYHLIEKTNTYLQRSQRYIEVDARMRAAYALPLAKAPSWGRLSDYTLASEQLEAVLNELVPSFDQMGA